MPKDKNQDIFSKICEKRGKPLAIRKGPFGSYLGCSGYPNCKFTANLNNETPVICPNCNSPLVVRRGQYGQFLNCTGHPHCKYHLDLKS